MAKKVIVAKRARMVNDVFIKSINAKLATNLT